MRCLFAMLLCLLLLPFPAPASADDFPPVDEDAPPELADRIARASRDIEHMRGLGPLGSVRARIQTRAEMRASLEAMIEREIDPAEIAATERLLKVMGILGREVGYLDMLMDLYEDQVAGYYDTVESTLFLLSDDGLDEDELILIHELFHAIQDQHFNLRALQETASVVGDAGLSRAALTEGDAMVVMTGAMLGEPMSQAQALLMMSLMEGMSQAVAPGEMADVPPMVWRQLVFPYVAGMGFILQVYSSGGWEKVNALYTRPPISTREILQPQAWIRGWRPTWLVTPELEGAQLAAPTSASVEACDLVADLADPEPVPVVEHYAADVVGVLTGAAMLQQLLDGLVAPARIERTMLSLAGDRLDGWAFGEDSDRDLVTWLTVWDSEAAAQAGWRVLVELAAVWVPEAREEQAAHGHGQRLLRVGPSGVLVVERWGDLVLVVFDTGDEVSPHGRCTQALSAADVFMEGHERTRYPSLEGEVEAEAEERASAADRGGLPAESGAWPRPGW